MSRLSHKKIWHTLKFRLERIVLSGTLGRIALMSGIVAIFSITAGLGALWVDPTFKNPAESIWWAFLRLTDPGYLGDDQGSAKRFISTTLTILGLAVFVGGLVAIVTQWLNETVRKLEMGLTPVSLHDHIVVLGWTDRTVAVVRELVRSQDRARRIIRLKRQRRLSIVVLAEKLDAAKLHEFRVQLGDDWDASSITLRSGSALRNEHLERVDFLRAAVIVIPGTDFGIGGPDAADTRMIKTILSIDLAMKGVEDRDELPILIAEIHDSRKVSLARRAYRGEIELLATDRVTACLMAQNTRHEGLSHIYRELLDQEGNELYMRQCPELVGQPFHSISAHFPYAIPVGTVRQLDGLWHALLCPRLDCVITDADHIVFMSEVYADTQPVNRGASVFELPESITVYTEKEPDVRHVLVLGWGYMLPTLLEELDGFANQRHEVTIVTVIPAVEREHQLRSHGVDLQNVIITHVEGDYTQSADLGRLDIAVFDQIIMLASEWVGTSEESDARTIVGFLLLREFLEQCEREQPPKILVELTDEDNQSLLDGHRVEILVSAELEGHMLAQVTLRPELRAVFDTLFGSRAPMFDFRPARTYPDVAGQPHSFLALQRIALGYEEIAIGVRVEPVPGMAHEDGGVILNPDKDSEWVLGQGDDLIVLARRA